ncbi:MAG: oxidoreductase [Nocardioidaceae bacterium]|nr:oxidoreductase [Nocardioidaceae bacterium]
MSTHRRLSTALTATAVSTMVCILAIAPLATAHGDHSEGRRDAPHSTYDWRITPTGSGDEFRGIFVVDRRTAWVSGENGTVLRTTDAGASWSDVSPVDAAGLALRDVEAFDDERAVTLSIGPGADSRIYATDDGGQSWTETFRNTEPTAFYDCMAFGPGGRGLALSDPVDGYFRLARTTDYGRTWAVQSDAGMPTAEDGEFAFAASGTCVVSGPGHTYWFATGGVDQPRIFRSADGGRSWSATETRLRGGLSSGVYSIDFRDPRHGVIVGGDYADEDNGQHAAAVSRDGGRTWELSDVPVSGYRSGVAYANGRTVIAVGPNGSDVSFDGGRTWQSFDDDRYDGVQCARSACWASGTDGRVARLNR